MKKFRNIGISVAMLVAPLGAIGITQTIGTTAAHATPPPPANIICQSGQNEYDYAYINSETYGNGDQVWTDTGTTWAANTVSNTAPGGESVYYGDWTTCNTVLGSNPDGSLYGYVWFRNRGIGTTGWLSENASKSDSQTSTGTSESTYEKYFFTCEDFLAQHINQGYFSIISVYNNDFVTVYPTLAGETNDVATTTTNLDADIFYASGTGTGVFCH